jgi:hypothetical protein
MDENNFLLPGDFIMSRRRCGAQYLLSEQRDILLQLANCALIRTCFALD